jgi:fructose 1,6-bisphosphatase|tara:strand:+ start:232 stop:540 length:309 start_codon:yes stop_codon:yes gene_type:complete
MSTYPVDIKTANITSATTTTVFDGPARILGLSWVVPTDVAVGTITVYDDSTAVWVVNTPATNTTDYKSPVFGHIMLPGTGIRCGTKLKVINAVVTHVTVYYG